MASRLLQKGTNRITQGYKESHKAVDLGRVHLTGEPVVAHSDGKVVFCQTGHKNNKGSTGNASYGNCVRIDHGRGIQTLYAHLASVKVKNGEKVTRGQVIGTMGNTGNSYGTHLHFEVRVDGKRVDPVPYLEADLPLFRTNHVLYKAYAGKWWPTVTDCNDTDANGYAGVSGRPMSALLARPERGILRYRVHLKADGRWLPWVQNDSDYAGNLGETIDAVQMVLEGVDGYQVRYRVSAGGRWYGWCTGLIDATGDGYAGVFGKAIDRIQIKIEAT